MATDTAVTYNGTIPSNSAFVDVDKLNDEQRILYLPTLIVIVVVMLIGILGNACVAVVYKVKFKRSSARVYIISLALADMSVCIVGMPYHIIDLTNIITYESVITCKILSFLIGSCTLSSIFILLVVGLDRYFKVCRPLKKQIVDFGDRKACIIAVALATLISLPYAFIYGNSSVLLTVNGNSITGSECFIDDHYSEYSESLLGIGYFGFVILLFVFSVVYLVVVYGLICRKIRRMDQFPITLDKAEYRCFCCRVDSKSIDDLDGDEDEKCGTSTEQLGGDTPLVHIKNDTGDDVVLKDEQMTESRQMAEREALVKGESSGSFTETKPVVAKAGRGLNKYKVCKKTSQTLVRHTMPGARVLEKHTRKITLMMLTITIVFIVTYLPFIAISVVDALDAKFWDGLSASQEIFYDFILRIYLLNNVANPIIYSFLDVKFRKELFNIFKNIFCCTVFKHLNQRMSEQSSSTTPKNTSTLYIK